MGTKTSVNSERKEKVAGDRGKGEGKPVDVASVDISKGSVKVDGLGDEKKGGVGQDIKKTREGVVDSPDNVTPVATEDVATKPISDSLKVTPPAATLKDDATKKKTTKPEDGVESSKQKVEPFIADEGDVATPKRVTKELPASPAESLKEKHVPTLGLTVPKSAKDGSAPLSSGSVLSPLQKVLEGAEDETLMERMARLKIGNERYQPPKDVVPPPRTDSEQDSECETAPSGPSTPRSRAGRGSFNLLIRSDVPLSDDDDFFLDCESNASVSNLDGV